MDALISTDELAGSLGQPDLLVFDCTVQLRPDADGVLRVEPGRERFDRGHIPTSGFIDQVDELSDPASPLRFTALGADDLAAAFAARGVGDGSRVVLYDSAFNMWATRAWWLLRSIGFDRASVLDGGWRAWCADDRPRSTDPEPSRPAAQLTARPRPGLIVGRDEVEAADRGRRHLPGQRPVGQGPRWHRHQLRPAGPHPRLPQRLRGRPGGSRDPPLPAPRRAGRGVLRCRGGGRSDHHLVRRGIAATSDAFTLLRLGHDDVAIYDGSLSEWQAAGLPLET